MKDVELKEHVGWKRQAQRVRAVKETEKQAGDVLGQLHQLQLLGGEGRGKVGRGTAQKKSLTNRLMHNTHFKKRSADSQVLAANQAVASRQESCC